MTEDLQVVGSFQLQLRIDSPIFSFSSELWGVLAAILEVEVSSGYLEVSLAGLVGRSKRSIR